MVKHYHITLKPYKRGFHIITDEILKNITLPKDGLFHLFIQHTSAAITINENSDSDVRQDFELYYNNIVIDQMPGMKHTIEGIDDMPAHIKTSITGNSISIPIENHQLRLGTWQGIYLCEFRNHPRSRKFIATIIY